MNKEYISNTKLIYYDKYGKEAQIIKSNFKKIISYVNELWGINPKKIKIYISKSTFLFILLTSKWYKKIFLLLFSPLYYLKNKKKWDCFMGASRTEISSILLKPMEVYSRLNTSVGKLIFKNESDNETKLITTLCH
ncbi:MAG: hypothetical protein ACOCRK_09290 [bacterium]